jgi:hypothetical protein
LIPDQIGAIETEGGRSIPLLPDVGREEGRVERAGSRFCGGACRQGRRRAGAEP